MAAKNKGLSFDAPKPLTTELEEQIMAIRSRIHELLVQSRLIYHDGSDSSILFVGPSSFWGAVIGRAYRECSLLGGFLPKREEP
jgi:hypothetical protein